MPSSSKLLSSIQSKGGKKTDAAQEHQHQRHSDHSTPAAESDPCLSVGSFTRVVDNVKAQGVHPQLPAGQEHEEPSEPLVLTAPLVIPSTRDTHDFSKAGGSRTMEPWTIDATSRDKSVGVPLRKDASCDPGLTPLNVSSAPPHASGFLANAHDFILNNPIMVDATNDNFMEKFAERTIKGAELDSSARDPPPRCHPGTRVEIVERMRSRLSNPTKRAQWLVGPAGVGKSAIMQTLAELEQKDSALFAALFFSAPNGRNDPSRVIATLAYQIALQHEGYHHYIRTKVVANPKLWEKSIDVQFTEFVVKPFAVMRIHTGTKPALMFIDGLDECSGLQEQIRILSLIFDFTTKHPQAPLLWVISSRPEAHITEYLNELTFYDKEEVSIDSTEACHDVERFLRAELERIRASNSLIKSFYRQWPPESQLMKLLAAILGLFAYAETAIRFIGDMRAGDPISRLQVILDLIDKSPKPLPTSDANGTRPMALLDSLYQYILSQVSLDNISRIEEILAYVIFSHGINIAPLTQQLVFMCNWIGMSPNVVYSALLQLHSVIYVPVPDDAYDQSLRVYHKSFSDFLLDPQRSGLSIGTMEDELHRHFLRSVRVLGDIPYSVTSNDPKVNITLSWPHPKKNSQDDLHFTASLAFWHMESLPDIPLPQIAHALKVLLLFARMSNPVTAFGYRILFNDTHPELSQPLREDGVLQDIPISLLDMNVIHKCGCSIRTEDSHTGWITSGQKGYPALLKELIACLHRARVQSPHDLVRVFIGTRLIGIVEFKTGALPEPKVFSFMYDFSTIYQHLKERREGESKDCEMNEGRKKRRKRAKGRARGH